MNYISINHAFKITGEILFLDSAETISLTDDKIKAIHIKESFIDNVLPLVSVDITISPKIRDMLRSNLFEIYLKGSLYDANENYSTDTDSDENIILSEDVF
jgi:hypothetical protein